MRNKRLGVMTGLILFGTVSVANASLVFNLGGCDFSSDPGGTGTCGGSGADLPDSALTMTFEQLGNTSDGTVQLTIDASGMPANTGKVTDIWFNSNFDFSDLTFDYVSGVVTEGIIAGGNVFSAVGVFDINFEYNTSGPLGELSNGVSVYNITGISLFENDFNVLSTGGYEAVMHVNVTGNGESGHYVPSAPVPEPATMLLLGTGLVGLVGYRLRKKKK